LLLHSATAAADDDDDNNSQKARRTTSNCLATHYRSSTPRDMCSNSASP